MIVNSEHHVPVVDVLGIIGAGKSTLLSVFPDTYTKVDEPVERNPWLEIFYAEMEYIKKLSATGRYTPAASTPMMEVYLLAKRKNDLDTARAIGKPIVNDFGRPGVFARVLHKTKVITDLDFETFREVEEACLEVPDYFIYLNGLDRAEQNRKDRGRSCEAGVDLNYQYNLHCEYEWECKRLSQMGAKGLRVDWPEGGSLKEVDAFLQDNGLPSGLDRNRFQKLLSA